MLETFLFPTCIPHKNISLPRSRKDTTIQQMLRCMTVMIFTPQWKIAVGCSQQKPKARKRQVGLGTPILGGGEVGTQISKEAWRKPRPTKRCVRGSLWPNQRAIRWKWQTTPWNVWHQDEWIFDQRKIFLFQLMWAGFVCLVSLITKFKIFDRSFYLPLREKTQHIQSRKICFEWFKALFSAEKNCTKN